MLQLQEMITTELKAVLRPSKQTEPDVCLEYSSWIILRTAMAELGPDSIGKGSGVQGTVQCYMQKEKEKRENQQWLWNQHVHEAPSRMN